METMDRVPLGPFSAMRLYDPVRSATHPAEAASRTVDVFQEQFGKLQQMRRAAEMSGHVVTKSDLSLKFEPQGLVLGATDGETSFSARAPEPTTTDVAQMLQRAKSNREARAEQARSLGASSVANVTPEAAQAAAEESTPAPPPETPAPPVTDGPMPSGETSLDVKA